MYALLLFLYLVRQFAEVCYGVVTYATIMNSTDLIDNISVARIIAVKGISEKQNISSKSLANKKLLFDVCEILHGILFYNDNIW